jgi:hypothetical protein
MLRQGDAPPAVASAAAREGLGAAARRALALALDVTIVLYGAALLLWIATGGIDLGIISVTQADKPILILLIVLPLRYTLDERSRLFGLTRVPDVRPHLRAVRTLATARLPTAVIDVGVALLVTRMASFFIAFIANLLYGRPNARAFEMPFTTEKFAEIFAAWDSGWYFSIATRGYYFEPGSQSSVAFFPLYPMLMRAVAWPFGGTEKAVWTAGIVVSCVCFALALLVVHRFTERTFGQRETARRAVLYLAVFPFSLFFTRVYAESVLLLTTVLAISRAYDGRWWQAGVWGGLAALARPNGILVGLPLALLALQGFSSWRVLSARVAALALVPLGLVGYCAYVYTLSGDPLGWMAAQEQWGYSIGNPPWAELLKMIGRLERYGLYGYFFVSPMAPFRLFHGVAALIFLALTPAVFKRLGAPLGLYVLVSLLVPLSGDALEGVGRYSAVLFPVFMVVASVKSMRLHESILIAASLFLALFVSLFVTLRPIY